MLDGVVERVQLAAAFWPHEPRLHLREVGCSSLGYERRQPPAQRDRFDQQVVEACKAACEPLAENQIHSIACGASRHRFTCRRRLPFLDRLKHPIRPPGNRAAQSQ
jgi:hypothetical protein